MTTSAADPQHPARRVEAAVEAARKERLVAVDTETAKRWAEEDALERRPMKVYTAGPMTGIPQFNFPAFDALAKALRERGFDVVSPAELDEQSTRDAALASPDGSPGSGSNNGETWGDFLARDVKLIADEVDGVVLMPGWETSKGARLEAFICRHVGKPVFYSITPVRGRNCADVCHCHTFFPARDAVEFKVWAQKTENDSEGCWLLELDDAELDRIFTLADLETLYKIARDEGREDSGAISGSLPLGVGPISDEEYARAQAAFATTTAQVRESTRPLVPIAGDPEVSFAPGLKARMKARIEEDRPVLERLADGEVRTVNESTGAEKGSKLARFDLIPAGPLLALAEHYGRGSEKYDDRNWEKGLDWHLCFAAMQRHAWAWWGGEDLDEETGSSHLTAVAWHAFALLEFMRTHPELDNRPNTETEER